MPTALFTRLLLTAAIALGAAAVPATASDKVKLTEVTVGFPPGGVAVGSGSKDRSAVSKFAAWAPVYASIEMLAPLDEPATLVIETPDTDEVTTVLTVPLDLSGLAPGAAAFAPDRGAIGYVRLAGGTSEVTVTVRSGSGAPLSAPLRVRPGPREALQYVVLAIGGAPAGFDLPRPPGTAVSDAAPLRNGRVELAHIADIAHLPDQWFGYEAADLVILNTGTVPADFLSRLFDPKTSSDTRKRDALTEWVRRGGRLVVSVGENAKAAAELPHIQRLLPYEIDTKHPSRSKNAVALYWSAGSSSQTNVTVGALDAKGGAPISLANLVAQPGRRARVISPPPNWKSDDPEPVAAQAAFGLGRVTVLAFDLDRAPFAEAQQRRDFWDWILRDCGANRASSGGDGKSRPAGVLTEDEDEAAAALRSYADVFDGIAVVSFGWVAVLIVLYILLIGPVEYYFLKRVLGRLELTWITFPIIVLTVSVAAYLSADAIKGRELKVNKIDVVDIDLASERVTGTTWFTVFSPRIDTYTVGVTPGDGWAATPEEHPGTIASIGAPRGGRRGLMSRKYGIHSDGTHTADALENVPIQVWSTKAFSASWSAPLASTPGTSEKTVRTDFIHPPGDPSRAIGTFVHTLPVPLLTECVAFYAGQAYPLPGGAIAAGQPVRLLFDQPTPANQWLQVNGHADGLLNYAQAYRERPGLKPSQKQQNLQQVLAGPVPLWTVLFHEATLKHEEGWYARNSSLRRLDQSWRLSNENRSEVIVVGRVAPPSGPAEPVLTGPAAASKLWLKGVPGTGSRPPLTGTARQETWVRFFLPVR